MADFEPFDLGRVLQTAEHIKGMRRQSTFDTLREQALRQNMAQSATQEERAQTDFKSKISAEEAGQRFRQAHEIEIADDPLATAQKVAPDIIRKFEAEHGEGSFTQLPPAKIKEIAGYVKKQAAPVAGISLDGTPEQQYATAKAIEASHEQHKSRLAEIAATGAEARKTASTRVEHREPPAGYRYNAAGNLEFIPGGPADPSTATSQRTLRPIPASAAQGIIENRAGIKKIDRALAAVEGNPDAFGMQNVLPDAATQRLPGKSFSGGLEPRAQVADIGSLIIHDRSGAAVTAAEFPRLKPFIPQSTDDAMTVAKKLKNLKANLESMQEEVESFYTPDAGYRPLSPPKEADANVAKEAPAAQEVTATGPNGEKIFLRNGAWVRQ